MTRFRDFRLLLALAAGAMAVSATAARAEYLQYKLYSAKVTSYSVNGSGLDDVPAPPPKIAAGPKTQAQYDFPGEYAQRFDGVDKGGKNESITIHGRYDLAHRLHRGAAPRPAMKTR